MALSPSSPPTRSGQLVERGNAQQGNAQGKAPQGQAQQEVFLREVDDALRQDQLTRAARRYGLAVLALVVVVLAGLAVWLWWDSRRVGAAEEAGESFAIALDQVEAGRVTQAQAALAPLATEDEVGAAARLMQAGLAAEQGRRPEAQRILAVLAADEEAPVPFRNLARVREVALGFDTMPPEQVVARLKPLADPGSPWFGSAGELLAAAYLKQGREDLAGPLLAAIAKDATVPVTLRSRTRQLAGLLGVDAVVDVETGGETAPSAAAAGEP